MENISYKNKKINGYRIVFVLLGWFTFIVGAIITHISYGIQVWLLSFKSFSMLTNILILTWFTFAIFSDSKQNFSKLLKGSLKGAIAMYAIITFILYLILLSYIYNISGFTAFSGVVLNIIMPIAFIFDWVFADKNFEYHWNDLIKWLIFPISYLIFTYLLGTFTGDYVYYFLNFNKLGIFALLTVIILVIFGIFIGVILILVNRKRIKKQS